MTPIEKLITDFHTNVTFYTHHITGEAMVSILNHHKGSFDVRTVKEAGHRIMNFKRMNLAIRRAAA